MHTADRKAALLALIQERVGRENAITLRELALRLGIPQRVTQELLRELVVDDEHGEILSTCRPPYGYFWASCLEEAQRYSRTLYSRGIENMKRRRAVKRAIPRLPTSRPVQPELWR